MKNLKFALIAILFAVTSFGPTKQVEAFSGECGVLVEQVTGRVLFEQCGDEQKYIASITKVMTAILAIEEGQLDTWVEISENATYQVGSSLYVKQGDRLKLMDLIYGLMLRSGNDAAMAIAEHVSGSEEEFVKLMNDKVKELGLQNTVFQNVSGLDETTFNLSSAYDMALIMRHAMNNPIFREIAGTKEHQATSDEGCTYVWHNKHKLVTGYYEDAIAGKTGFTKKARRTLITSAARDNLELVVVTLNDGNDWQDHTSLFEYGFSEYELKHVLAKGDLQLNDENVTKSLFVEDDVYVTLKKDGSEALKTELEWLEDTTTNHVATLRVTLNDDVIDEVAVYEKIIEVKKESSWFEKLFDWLFDEGQVI